MPDSGEGSFDGGGSVRWEVVVEEDDDRKGESLPDGAKGRKSKGVDKRPTLGKYFRIIMKVPTDEAQKRAFLQQFQVAESKGTIEVRLPLAKVDRQIKVKWDGDGWLPPISQSS